MDHNLLSRPLLADVSTSSSTTTTQHSSSRIHRHQRQPGGGGHHLISMRFLFGDRCRRWSTVTKSVLVICLFLFVVSLLFVGYLCPDRVCALSSVSLSESRYQAWSNINKVHLQHNTRDNMGRAINSLDSRPFSGQQQRQSFISGSSSLSNGAKSKWSFDEMLRDNSFVFDIKGNDVIVFLHIQKTGGTSFGRHLVKDLDLEYPCECKKGRKRCRCVRPDSGSNKLWLFSRYSTGWKCGLHADWTELTNCVDTAMDESEKVVTKRRYFYITLLREPVGRFLSEFRHVQRGATWKSSRHWCGGRTATMGELPSCYSGSDWSRVSLKDFISCPDNLGFNRQTRMLADLSLVGCYNRSIMSERDRDVLLLASAKENLRKMAFFGLCEFQKYSQYLFESTFKLRFLRPFIQLNETHSSLTMNGIGEDMLQQIRQLNRLDIELYEYAKNLLIERFEQRKQSDPDFEENLNRLDDVENDEDAPETRLMKKMKLLSQKNSRTVQKALRKTSTTTSTPAVDESNLDELMSDF